MLTAFQVNQPASSQDIVVLRKAAGDKLPIDYLNFMSASDGGEGAIGANGYLMLWRASEIPELNESYQVNEYAPGLLLFGSDGGGEAFAFDLRSSATEIVQVPFVGMNVGLAQRLGTTFAEFLKQLGQA